MADLILERRNQPDETVVMNSGANTFLFTPPIDEDYWEYRVVVADGQAVVGFPKFGTIGVGFAVEDYDWNTNWPYSGGSAEEIVNHIWGNRGPNIPDTAEARALVAQAVTMIQEAVRTDRGE